MPEYTILIYSPSDRVVTDGQVADERPKWAAITQELIDAGVMRGGNALEGTDTATTVRVRDGETLVTDGPFAETKESLAGYYLIDVPDLDAALAWAAKLPNASYGSLEVRPVVVFADDEMPAMS